jgi:hypothetical protein
MIHFGDFMKFELQPRPRYSIRKTLLFEFGRDNLRSKTAVERIGGRLIAEKEKAFPDGRTLVSAVYSIRKADFKGL